ncbi:hypothetical protein FRC10_003181, partial [Ceratobasidium sp. 414]
MPPACSTSNCTSVSKTNSLAVQAHQAMRMVDMWWPGSDIVTTGKEMDSMTDDELIEFREAANH